MLHQHMEQPDKIQGLLHAETWHNKEQWKSKNIHLFKREKNQLVQSNFERIQRTIDTPWKIWSMSIPLEEFCSNMITSRGWVFFSSPSFLSSLFCQDVSTPLYSFLKSESYIWNISTFSLAAEYAAKLDLGCRKKQHQGTVYCKQDIFMQTSAMRRTNPPELHWK